MSLPAGTLQQPLQTKICGSLEGPRHRGLRLGAIPRAALPLGQYPILDLQWLAAMNRARALLVHSRVGCARRDTCNRSWQVVRLHWVCVAGGQSELPQISALSFGFNTVSAADWSFCLPSTSTCLSLLSFLRPFSQTRAVTYRYACLDVHQCSGFCRCAALDFWQATAGGSLTSSTPLSASVGCRARGLREVSVALGPPPCPFLFLAPRLRSATLADSPLVLLDLRWMGGAYPLFEFQFFLMAIVSYRALSARTTAPFLTDG